VYLQVQHLFKDAPDLLSEFKVFLGEVAGPQNGVVILPQPSGDPSPWLPPGETASSPAVVSARKPPSAKRKKRTLEKEPTPVPQVKLVPPSRVSDRPSISIISQVGMIYGLTGQEGQNTSSSSGNRVPLIFALFRSTAVASVTPRFRLPLGRLEHALPPPTSAAHSRSKSWRDNVGR